MTLAYHPGNPTGPAAGQRADIAAAGRRPGRAVQPLRGHLDPPARTPTLHRYDGYDLPAHKIHLATLPGGKKWIADLQDEEPHLFIAAGTGGGKTATASIPAAHYRANGWLVGIIDPKRRSYISRKTGHDVLTNVPGIPMHTDLNR